MLQRCVQGFQRLRPDEYSAMQILDSVIKASENLMAQTSHRPSKASLGPLPMNGNGGADSASGSGSLCSSNPDEHDALASALGRCGSRTAGRVDGSSSNPSPVSTWTNWPELPVADAWRSELQNSHPYTVSAPHAPQANKAKNAARVPVAQIFENVTVGPYGTLKKRHDHVAPPPPHRVSGICELSESLDGSNAQLADETLRPEAEAEAAAAIAQADDEFPAPPDARLLATFAPSTGDARASPRSDATDEEGMCSYWIY